MKMEKWIFRISMFFFSIPAFSQENEFKIYPNGLMYDEQTMSKLGHIADSLNLRFKVCDFNKKFYSIRQTFGHVIKLSKGNIENAKRDLISQMPFESFIRKYPAAAIEKNELILMFRYTSRNNEQLISIEHFDPLSNYDYSMSSLNDSIYTMNHTNKWIFEYYDKTSYSKASITAFYFPEDFKSIPIPGSYAKMIGYSDCLIDTTTAKFKDAQEGDFVELPEHWHSLSRSEKIQLLNKMRSTRVIGGCSMDSRPRIHALNIALL
ncbi:MAG: hypothetical protein ABUL44_03540, partial [Flavobacterium sp.]